MTRSILFVLVALSFAGCTSTAGPNAFLRSTFTRRPVDSQPPLPHIDADSLKALYPTSAMAFLTDERTIEHQVDFPADVWDYVQDIRRQYVVLDPDEDRATTFALHAGRRDVVEGVALRITSPAGDVRSFALADLAREPEGDGAVYKFAYPGAEFGSVIEESFRLRRGWDRSYQPPLYQDVPLQSESPVDRMTFRYIYPSSWALGLKRTAAETLPPVAVDRETKAHYTILTSDNRNVPPFTREPFSPFYKETAPYLEFAVTKILDRDVLPLYEAPASWDALTRDFSKYVFSRRGGTSGPVAQQARSIADPAAPDSVRLAAIVGWVQSQIELVDEGGATNLQEVLRTRKANELLITGLTQALLEEAGFEAQYVLVHPASEGYFDPAFVNLNQFTAPAIVVHMGDVDRVVFPYIAGLPVTYIPEPFQRANAMSLTATGFDSFLILPSGLGAQSSVEETIDVRLDEDGAVQVTETATLHGGSAYDIRDALHGLDAAERDTKARTFVTYDEGAIRDFSFTVEGESNAEVPVVLTLRYAIDDLVTLTPDEVLFQTGGLLSPASLSAFEEAPGTRRNPIKIAASQLTTKTISVHFPEAWSLTTDLADAEETTGFGSASSAYTRQPGLVTAAQRIELRASRAPATQYPSLARLTGSASKLYVPTLVFSR